MPKRCGGGFPLLDISKLSSLCIHSLSKDTPILKDCKNNALSAGFKILEVFRV
jgi:hypothetical protein